MKTYHLLFLLFSCAFVSAQNFDYHPSDWAVLNDADFKFKKAVQQVESTTFTLKQDDKKGEMWQKDILTFDHNRLSKWEQIDLQFGQNFTQVYHYVNDDDFKLRSRKIIDSSGMIIDEAIYVYDKKNKDKISEILVKEFDPNLSEAPAMEFKIDVVSDANGVREKDVYYGPTGELRYEIKLGYDKAGLISSKKRFDKDQIWITTDSIEYGELFRKTKEITMYPNRNPGEEPILVEMSYAYNWDGYVSEMEIQDSVISFEYELNNRMHWVKRRSYITRDGEKKPYQLVERKIVYGN